MAREIKFRAWHKNDKSMCQNVKTDLLDRNYFEFNQYTGLKDKNCNEIYEGDIVEIDSHKYYIQYDIGSFMLVRCSYETDMYNQFKNCWNDDVYPLSQFYWDDGCEENIIYSCEIIGNIFQD